MLLFLQHGNTASGSPLTRKETFIQCDIDESILASLPSSFITFHVWFVSLHSKYFFSLNINQLTSNSSLTLTVLDCYCLVCIFFSPVSFPFSLFILSSPSNQDFYFENIIIVSLKRRFGFEGCKTKHFKWFPIISVYTYFPHLHISICTCVYKHTLKISNLG